MATDNAPGFGTRFAAFMVGLFGLVASGHAVPARPGPMEFKNADGSVVMGRMFGDERLSWVEDLSGYAMAYDPQSGTWNYAQEGRDGRLSPTALRAGRIDPAAAGLTTHLRPSRSAIDEALASRKYTQHLTQVARSKVAKGLGRQRSVKNLVILVRFSDQTSHFQPTDFDPILNGATSSVRAFYKDVSYGQFDLTSVVVPWVPLPNPASFYAYNDYVNGHPEGMIHDAVAYLNQQGFDFKQFDADNDGYVDAVDIIHSGEAYENSHDRDTIWSHYAPFDGFIFKSPVTHDGLLFTGYHTEAEYGPRGSEITQIGVICHETAHFFGAPDLYDYDYDSAGLGMWSLMAAGSWGGNLGSTPSAPDAYSRIILGFATATVLAADQTGVKITPVELDADIYRIDQNMPRNQYFLLEDRQKIGFDQSVPGSGLLIYHVDEGQMNEDDQNRYLVDLEQADGKRTLNTSAYSEGDSTDAWPLTTKKDFAPWSKPGSAPYQDQVGIQPAVLPTIWVQNIARAKRADGYDDLTFDLAFKEPLLQGEACASYTECSTGFCVDGVCCDRSCVGPCESCSKADGALVDGKCASVEGKVCDDKKACTENDVCSKGVCKGTPKVCPAADGCHEAGVCQATDGTCLVKNKLDGAGCDDGDQCTTVDVCKAGTCTGTAPRACIPLDSCHVAGACDSATGLCSDPQADDGTACAENSSCVAGVCTEKPTPPDAGTPPEPPKPPPSCGNCATGGAGLTPALGMLVAALGWVARRRSIA